MKKLLLIRYGEISLKGLNKNYFIDTLVANIKYALKDFDGIKVIKLQGRLTVEDYKSEDEELVIDALKKVFGIVYITKAVRTDNDIENIKSCAATLMQGKDGCTFKVESRRADKAYPMESPEISKAVGAAILRNTTGLKVDVHTPDILLGVEIRKDAYITYENINGESGLPMGTGGKGGVLLSGGIDSPVAAYLTARRGMKVYGIHFHSYPFTSLNAKDKVIELAKKLSKYNNGMQLAMFSLTDIQQEIIKNCNETYLTVILRRYMLKIAEIYAKNNGLNVLITGESLGQVASQTVESIICTDNAVDIPIFRPLIAMDKNEIIKHANHIDTYDISIEPYEDCCTIFVPKHPQTRPKLEKVLLEETKLPMCDELIAKSIETAEILNF